MSNPKNKKVTGQTTEIDELTLLAKMTRLLGILVRLNLQTLKGERSQNDMISMLDSLGCGQSEIAELLGTTANTVSGSLCKAKRKAAKK